VSQLLLADPKRFGRNPDDGEDLLAMWLDQRDQVPEQLSNRERIFFRSLFDEPALERPVELEHWAVVQRFPPKENGLLKNLAGNHVHRPADITVQNVAGVTGTGDRAARGA